MPPEKRDGPQTGGGIFAADARAKFQEAARLFQSGQFERARQLLEAVVRLQPRHADALHLLGVIAARVRNYHDACAFFSRAVALDPANAGFHFNYGIALHELGHLNEALASYDRTLALKPDAADAYFNRGNALLALQRYDDAAASYQQTIAIQPNNSNAHNNSGLAFQALQRFQAAVDCYDSALALNPRYVEAYYNRGNALQALRQYKTAVASYDQALALQPNSAEAHNNRGNALHGMGRFEEAAASFDRALRLKPNYADALNNRGNALQALDRLEDAINDYDAALALKADYVEAYCNRARALQMQHRFDKALSDCDHAVALAPNSAQAHASRAHVLYGVKRFSEAIASYDAALAIDPSRAATHNDRGNALRSLKRYDEAVQSYEAALRCDPEFEFLLGTYIHTKMELCDWNGFSENKKKLTEAILAQKKAAPPFVLFGLLDDPRPQQIAAQTWTRSKHASAPRLAASLRAPGEKIRVGYYSADFHDHATMYLMAEMFEAYDRERFELYGFSFGPDAASGMRARVSSAFHRFFDIKNVSDEDAVSLSRDLTIDIAVDLKGYTEDSRPGLFARRCAPLQVSFLGYPGTMGADFIDYLVADSVLIPALHRNAFEEKIIYLPTSYQPNDSKRRISDRVFTRRELGLPETGFVFCGFHASYKITPETFDSWMRILRSTPDSVLWLLEGNTTAVKNLCAEAEARDVDASRLVFAKHMTLDDHLARLRHADLFLDAQPCCAHTTASDALWAGLPLLTRAGEAFAGRVAASLLTALHLPELIANEQADYEAQAITLAADPTALATIRAKLQRNKATSPLFDGRAFARNLEAAYEAILARHQAGLAPDHLEI